MARDLGATGYLTAAAAAMPLDLGTIAGWIKMSVAPAGLSSHDFLDTDTSRYSLASAGPNGAIVYIDARQTPYVGPLAGLWSAGDWVHFTVGYNKSGNVQKLYVQGTELTPSGAASGTWGSTAHGTNLYLGSAISGVNPNGGAFAEWATWSALLGADEIAALAKGFNAQQIRPASLNAYWELFGNDSPEPDSWKNGYAATLVNSPTKADHPRIYYPSRAKVFVAPSSVASFTADLAAAAVLVAALSVGAGFSAAATGTATTSAALTTGEALRADVTATAATSATLSTGASFRADAIGTASTSAAFAEIVPIGRPSVTIGGTVWRTREGTVTVHDLLNDAPNTCSFTVGAVAPAAGQEVRITLGNGTVFPDLLFAGSIVNVDATYELTAANRAWRVNCQDFTRTINRRKVRKRYAQQSATAIGIDLATYATGFSTAGIVAGLPTVTGGIDFTEEDLLTCYRRLAGRIGGYADVDYEKVIRLFLTEASDAPDPLVPGSPTLLLEEPEVTWSVDHSQLRTRVYVEGGGAQARTAVAIGATSILVTDASWYSGTGGILVSGPQRITYTGKGLAGGPAAPSAAQSLVAGNLGSGPYTYKVSQVAAGTESNLSAASASVTIDPVPNPTTAITAANGGASAPSSAPTAAKAIGGNLSAGAYQWKTSYVTAGGETTPSPASSSVTMNAVARPTQVWGSSPTQAAGSVEFGFHRWKMTFLVGALETEGGISDTFTLNTGNALVMPALQTSDADPAVTARKLYRTKIGASDDTNANFFLVTTINNNTPGQSYTDTTADASLGASHPPDTTTAIYRKATVDVTASADPNVTGINVYRTVAGGSTFKKVATISNATQTYTDNIADGSLGADAPTTNTSGGSLGVGTYGWKIVYKSAAGTTLGNTAATASITTGGGALSSITTSADARVTARDLYRTAVNGSTYLYEGTINNNTATTFTSTIADGALGSAIPTTNTTAAGKINVTGIATGGGTVTARKLYRVPSGGTTYKLVQTIGNNVDTTFLDNVADGSLGVVAPGDTQSELTGIPSSGPGSVLYEILIGDEINILEQCDDVDAQTALAALEGGDSDGIYEHFIQDRRLASAEARATGFADLALFSRPITTVRYGSHDPKTRSGKTIHVDLPALALLGDFTITSVTIDQIGTAHPEIWPRYIVEASSVRFSFEDVLRRLQLVA